MRPKLPLFLLPPDTFERHHVVAQYLKQHRVTSVLDVGGEGLLGRLLPGVKCVAININDSGDAQYDGSALPFPPSAFDAVVSLDTLEHLPRANRRAFVEELFRVAGRAVALSVPFGSTTHVELEREALETYRRVQHKDHQYLREHVEYGLPGLPELEALFAGWDFQALFCGDCRKQSRRFTERCLCRPASESKLRAGMDILREAN